MNALVVAAIITVYGVISLAAAALTVCPGPTLAIILAPLVVLCTAHSNFIYTQLCGCMRGIAGCLWRGLGQHRVVVLVFIVFFELLLVASLIFYRVAGGWVFSIDALLSCFYAAWTDVFTSLVYIVARVYLILIKIADVFFYKMSLPLTFHAFAPGLYGRQFTELACALCDFAVNSWWQHAVLEVFDDAFYYDVLQHQRAYYIFLMDLSMFFYISNISFLWLFFFFIFILFCMLVYYFFRFIYAILKNRSAALGILARFFFILLLLLQLAVL